MKSISLLSLIFLLPNFLFLSLAPAAKSESSTLYFSCRIKETYSLKSTEKNKWVNVKFAVKNLNVYQGKGQLIPYPGADEDEGYILVTPKELPDGKYAMMTNLNGQGGDLRVDSSTGNIRLFGDGAGYQFTDLVLWDVEDRESDVVEGYVRDYGPTYGDSEHFKQFIKCKVSDKVL